MNAINTSKLTSRLSQLEFAIPKFEKFDSSISNSNIGWHIEHSLLVFNGIIETLSKSNPKDYTWKLNFKRIVVFAKRKIPRGIAKAPKVVIPKENYSIESLLQHIEKTKIKLEELRKLNPKQFFNHPGFGNLRLKKTIQFLEIHTQHHLEIIADIERGEE